MPREKSPGKPTTRRYTEAEKAQAVRLVRQLREELGTSQGTVGRVAEQLGYGIESVRKWVQDADVAEGVAGPDAQRVRELEQRNDDPTVAITQPAGGVDASGPPSGQVPSVSDVTAGRSWGARSGSSCAHEAAEAVSPWELHRQ